MIKFAFLGRCSTEDQQDPESSRHWQLNRANALIQPRGGVVVAEYFDIGHTRALPWQRRPRAKALLAALADPGRGFEAVVIGEPHRAFYGNQFGLTFPLFTHYGVQMWVPEVGGPLDPENEAHDLVMSVFGGMSKGERNRIKVRVRTSMAAQTQMEGRFLGGRPPYGYQIVDAGPHPHPAKAADGRRLHRLDLHPETAAVVERIFDAYLAGRGIYAIAEQLTSEGIACPSAHDPQRNRHRSGVAWSKMAIRAILANPRYTGHQVWNRQRKDEVLMDVHDVAMGHRTKLVWNPADKWVWSHKPAHPAIIDIDTFEQVRAKLASRGAATPTVKPRRSRHTYLFRGVLFCSLCGRRMQGQWLRGKAYYRCRFPDEYATANKLAHPRNVYLREDQLVAPLDEWLLSALAPPRLEEAIEAMYASQLDSDQLPPQTGPAQQTLVECDRKIANYRALLDAGTDPALVAGWITEATAERAAAQARLHAATGARSTRLTKQQIRELVAAVGPLRQAIRRADLTTAKAAIYQRLGIRMTYQPAANSVRTDAKLGPDAVGKRSVSEGRGGPEPYVGIGSVSGGGFDPLYIAPALGTGVNAYVRPGHRCQQTF
jgi:DNA invertase Pin-like site-specific DNA recombinase